MTKAKDTQTAWGVRLTSDEDRDTKLTFYYGTRSHTFNMKKLLKPKVLSDRYGIEHTLEKSFGIVRYNGADWESPTYHVTWGAMDYGNVFGYHGETVGFERFYQYQWDQLEYNCAEPLDTCFNKHEVTEPVYHCNMYSNIDGEAIPTEITIVKRRWLRGVKLFKWLRPYRKSVETIQIELEHKGNGLNTKWRKDEHRSFTMQSIMVEDTSKSFGDIVDQWCHDNDVRVEWNSFKAESSGV